MKSKFLSKTLWFNGLGLLVAIAGPVLAGYGYTGEVPAELAVFVPAGIFAVNFILRRFFTNTGLQ